MIVFEFKAKGTKQQYQKIDQAIRITQFIRNKCLRFWMDNQNVKYYDLNKHTAVLANEFDFADKLNSMARQSAAERTAFAIKRFFDNCQDLRKISLKSSFLRDLCAWSGSLFHESCVSPKL